MRHTPVLTKQVLEGLQLQPGMVVVDGTLGDGGHALTMLERIGPAGRLIGIDADSEAILRAKKILSKHKNVTFVRDNFKNLSHILRGEQVDAIVLDLGWSMPQFKERGRGFSFEGDEPLDMRFDPSSGKTAAELIAGSTEAEIQRILHKYGEEPRSKALAKAIHSSQPKTSAKLVEAVMSVYKGRGKTHPATRTFQALRIWTNDELQTLKEVLAVASESLKPGGRLAVISFHSLEDRIVKQFLKASDTFINATKKPITASADELAENPSARSAKLRVAQKIHAPSERSKNVLQKM